MLLDDEEQGPVALGDRRRRGFRRGVEAALCRVFGELVLGHGRDSMKLLAGASGYSFKEWKGSFYPADMKPEGMLGFYSARLPTVEINNTFYRMPKTAVVAAWAAQVPDGFRFAIKASRRITHIARLKTETAAEPLGFLY